MNKLETVLRLFGGYFPSSCGIQDLSGFTTWNTGGPAVMLKAESKGMLADILGVCTKEGIPWLVLGRGSNVLVSDDGFHGAVIRLTGALADAEWKDCPGSWTVRAGAGISLPRLAGAACTKGASGLAFAIGIPGTLGGAVCMNAGAYGSSISDRIEKVEELTLNGSFETVRPEDCGFQYRTSIFLDRGTIITGAVLLLEKDDPAALRKEAGRLLQMRRDKFPLEYPNAGSVFRKPDEGVPPGKLIEDAGLKGTRVGDAMVSKKHANFIVNLGSAKSEDIRELIGVVREEVLVFSGILLHEEIRYIGWRS